MRNLVARLALTGLAALLAVPVVRAQPAPATDDTTPGTVASLQTALDRMESALRAALASAETELARLKQQLDEMEKARLALLEVVRQQQSQLAALQAAQAPPAQDTAEVYTALLAKYRPAFVSVKYVQRTQGRFGSFDGENEINAVVISPNGLVLCSNAALGLGGGRFRGRTVPTDIKVLIGDDTEGRPASFIARDSELDLAWLQIKDAEDELFAHVDFATAAAAHIEPRLGDPVIGLGVMGKFFGQHVLVSGGRIVGATDRPRKLYVVRGGPDTDYGLPVFLADGRVLGVVTIQRPDEEETSGSASNLMARGGGLILPLETVVRATERAQQIAREEAAEAVGRAEDTAPDLAEHEALPNGADDDEPGEED